MSKGPHTLGVVNRMAESIGTSFCPVCNAPDGILLIRAKLVCTFCGQIIEGCCEGENCTFPQRIPMTSNEYQRLTGRTEAPAINEVMRLVHHAFGACSEAGELANQMKRHLFYGKPLDRINLIEECGDILWYVSRMLDVLDIEMEDCMERNIAKLTARYPERFSTEAASNRDLVAERTVLEQQGPPRASEPKANQCMCGGIPLENGSGMCDACYEEYLVKMHRTRPTQPS